MTARHTGDGRGDAVTVLFTSGEEREAEHLEGPGVGFAGGAGERIDRLADHDIREAGLLEHRLPARTGQPAGDSTGPQVDVAHHLRRHGTAVGDVGELQPAART